VPAGERLDVRDARARLIVPALPEPGQTVRLSPEEAAHARARRLAPGDAVLLLDGSGRAAVAHVVRLSRTDAVLSVSEVFTQSPREPAISLFVAGLRTEKLAWVVEKATELGVANVVLLETGRTQSFRASPKVLPRLESVARAAAKQCERFDWPTLSGPVEFARALEGGQSAHRFLLDFDGEQVPRRLAHRPSALIVGPEGGWTDSERSEATDRGWRRVTLPAGKLRTETAAIAALVLLRAAFERTR
jgi:16S rRNA (uracil1498-N3)-methyltransferase